MGIVTVDGRNVVRELVERDLVVRRREEFLSTTTKKGTKKKVRKENEQRVF